MCAEHGNTRNVRCDWLHVAVDRVDVPVEACDVNGLEVAQVAFRCHAFLVVNNVSFFIDLRDN